MLRKNGDNGEQERTQYKKCRRAKTQNVAEHFRVNFQQWLPPMSLANPENPVALLQRHSFGALKNFFKIKLYCNKK